MRLIFIHENCAQIEILPSTLLSMQRLWERYMPEDGLDSNIVCGGLVDPHPLSTFIMTLIVLNTIPAKMKSLLQGFLEHFLTLSRFGKQSWMALWLNLL
ncbi:hypothetical protein TCAL_17158 [Tigriopus californicus]|uniref:Uncharacterized protein n=1 Tax=Tigriopus californicus TaxID=6832 RepID=A0A553P4G2_TIGCA|nr:hypothetical protein TCAL_17158 [Tigriopus californicus]